MEAMIERFEKDDNTKKVRELKEPLQDIKQNEEAEKSQEQ